MLLNSYFRFLYVVAMQFLRPKKKYKRDKLIVLKQSVTLSKICEMYYACPKLSIIFYKR